MRRAYATGWLVLMLCIIQPVCHAGAEQPATLMSERDATALALDTLGKELGVKGKDIRIVHISRVDWPNSALGCPKPGLSYTQTILPGYLALLSYEKKHYRVHIGSGRAIVCRSSRMTLQSSDVIHAYLRKRAKEDLAARLGIDAARVQVVEDTPKLWSASQARCSKAESQDGSKRVRGYLMKLKAEDRTFEYRTSGSRVLACPPIEAE